MNWYEVEVGLPSSHKIGRLSRRLSIPRREAIGIVLMLWDWTASHRAGGDLSGLDAGDLEDGCRWGLPDPVLVVEALVFSNLVDRDREGSLSVHGWPERQARCKRVRENTAQRQRKRRNVPDDSSHAPVTPESRACHAPVTPESRVTERDELSTFEPEPEIGKIGATCVATNRSADVTQCHSTVTDDRPNDRSNDRSSDRHHASYPHPDCGEVEKSLGSSSRLSEGQVTLLDEMRRKILDAFPREWAEIDRAILDYVRSGEPYTAMIRVLASLARQPAGSVRDPVAYISRPLRIEAQNENEAKAMEKAKGFSSVGVTLQGLMEAAGKAASVGNGGAH